MHNEQKSCILILYRIKRFYLIQEGNQPDTYETPDPIAQLSEEHSKEHENENENIDRAGVPVKSAFARFAETRGILLVVLPKSVNCVHCYPMFTKICGNMLVLHTTQKQQSTQSMLPNFFIGSDSASQGSRRRFLSQQKDFEIIDDHTQETPLQKFHRLQFEIKQFIQELDVVQKVDFMCIRSHR